MELEDDLNNAFEGLPLDFGGIANVKSELIVFNSRPRSMFEWHSGDAVSGCRRNISAPTLVGPGCAIINFGNRRAFRRRTPTHRKNESRKDMESKFTYLDGVIVDADA